LRTVKSSKKKHGNGINPIKHLAKNGRKIIILDMLKIEILLKIITSDWY
jgi:hypothetical protein